MTDRPATFNVLKAEAGEDPWATDKEEYGRKYRRMDHPELFALIDKYDLQTGDIDFESNPGDDSNEGRDPLNTEKLITEAAAEQSNSFSSRIRRWVGGGGNVITIADGIPIDRQHLPIFDIDHSVLAWETSTPGHYHLIIDRPMSREDYEKLMRVLVEVGIVQEGYQRASLKRKAAWLRMPWIRKKGF